MTATHVELHTVRRLRDAATIAHRLTRTYSRLRENKQRPARFAQWPAYPLSWINYFALVSLMAGNAVHHGVAVAVVPNPVTRWRRWPLVRGLAAALAILVVVLAVTDYAAAGDGIIAHAVLAVLGVCLLASAWEFRCQRPAEGHGPPADRETAHHDRRLPRADRPRPHLRCVAAKLAPVRPLFDAALTELRTTGVTLIVDARDDETAAIICRTIPWHQSQPRLRPTHRMDQRLTTSTGNTVIGTVAGNTTNRTETTLGTMPRRVARPKKS